MKKLSNKGLALIAWFIVSYIFSFSLLIYLLIHPTSITPIQYSVFASKPPTEVSTDAQINGIDARAAIIDQYFANHKCPLTGTGNKMVEVADQYNLDFWLIPAIAWQESTCGKSIIPSSNNPFGYGIYGDKVYKFENFDEAIETLGKYFQKYFYTQGITEPCDIEKIYTPPSNGSWCKSIKFFRDELLDYKTPN